MTALWRRFDYNSVLNNVRNVYFLAAHISPVMFLWFYLRKSSLQSSIIWIVIRYIVHRFVFITKSKRQTVQKCTEYLLRDERRYFSRRQCSGDVGEVPSDVASEFLVVYAMGPPWGLVFHLLCEPRVDAAQQNMIGCYKIRIKTFCDIFSHWYFQWYILTNEKWKIFLLISRKCFG